MATARWSDEVALDNLCTKIQWPGHIEQLKQYLVKREKPSSSIWYHEERIFKTLSRALAKSVVFGHRLSLLPIHRILHVDHHDQVALRGCRLKSTLTMFLLPIPDHLKPVELTIFSKYWARLQECYDFGVLLKRTGDLFPRDELCHLFCQLPELLKVYMSIW